MARPNRHYTHCPCKVSQQPERLVAIPRMQGRKFSRHLHLLLLQNEAPAQKSIHLPGFHELRLWTWERALKSRPASDQRIQNRSQTYRCIVRPRKLNPGASGGPFRVAPCVASHRVAGRFISARRRITLFPQQYVHGVSFRLFAHESSPCERSRRRSSSPRRAWK